jgi:hypothetical protein
VGIGTRCTLVAIMRNEQRFIEEWIAYHLVLGFSPIVIYDNESTDDGPEIISRIAAAEPAVGLVTWPDVEGVSPQRSAYNNALSTVETEWVAFFDIDEFFVPASSESVGEFLELAPADASAIALNWRIFGSSGRADDTYSSVVETFTRCSEAAFIGNEHYKVMARTKDVQRVGIHHVALLQGRYVLSDFSDLAADELRMGRIVHGHAWINHYQSKTFADFTRRMSNGDSNYPGGHENKVKDGSHARFEQLDRNEDVDLTALRFLPRVRSKLDAWAATALADRR